MKLIISMKTSHKKQKNGLQKNENRNITDLQSKSVKCLACSHYCIISENKTGMCRVRKNIKGNVYCYVVSRERGKVKFDYKGKLNNDEIKKYKQTKEYRAKYRKSISELNKQIKFLRGVLRGKKSI